MNQEFLESLRLLSRKGWDVQLRVTPANFPGDVIQRYSWCPDGVREFVENTDAVIAPNQKSWFLTSSEFAASSDSAFRWNQWEVDCLEAADSDPEWQAEIVCFWDRHFPLMLSLKSGYAYFAIRQEDLVIVAGEEPEFEGTAIIATSFPEFLTMVSSNDPRLARWI
jgi:hypothetical protein